MCGQTAEVEGTTSFIKIRWPVDPNELGPEINRKTDLDVLNVKIEFNVWVGRVLVALIPVALAIGIVIGS